MADNKDLFHPQHEDSGHQAADNRARHRVDNRVAGVLDDLGLAPLESHGRFEKIYQTGIHAGKDGDLLIRRLGQRRKGVGPDKTPVGGDNRFQFVHATTLDRPGRPFC